MHYREPFVHESREQLNSYFWPLGYFVASIAVVLVLLAWRRRIEQEAARVQPPVKGGI